jgi:hypothetical protein
MTETPWVVPIFLECPQQWGLRGDPYLWDEIEKTLMVVAAPKNRRKFESLEKSEFERIVGVPVTHGKDVFVERFAFGGMSSGYVCVESWRGTALPLLCQRFADSLLGQAV